MTSQQTTMALSTADPATYAVMESDPAELAEILADNLGGEALSARDLPRVTVPAGGATSWEVPGVAGVRTEKQIDGVIIHTRMTRGYWASDEANGSPPDCSSPDCQFGRGMFGQGSAGNPSGSCLTCPMARFGSHTKGEGQACKQKQELYLLLPGSVLPLVVTVPPTSLKTVRQYLIAGLAGAGYRHYGVVTRFALREEKNARGQRYSQIVPQMMQPLTPEQAARMKGYREAFRQVLAASEMDEMIDPGA